MMSFKMYIASIGNDRAFLGFNANRDKTPFTVLGVPLDISSSFRRGSSTAPQRIREVSRSLELCSVSTGLDMERIGFEDLGDIVLPPGDINAALSRIEEVVRGILDENRVTILIGGEHTVTLPGFKALASRSSRPCLLVFDAHADLREEYLGSRYNHATVVKRVLDEVGGRVVIVGARALSKEEVDTQRKLSNRITVVNTLRGFADGNIGQELSENLKECNDIYVSIDMDVIDPAYAPGVQTPEPLGIDPVSLLNILNKIVDDRVRLIDIVEISPIYDVSDITSFLAARIIVEVAALVYMSKYRGRENYRCW